VAAGLGWCWWNQIEICGRDPGGLVAVCAADDEDAQAIPFVAESVLKTHPVSISTGSTPGSTRAR
jgi:hypothetical protein